MNLDEIVQLLHDFDGIARKLVLPSIIGKLRDASYNADTPHSLGEDSAAIGTRNGDFVLLTTDAIVEELCLNYPRAAGFNVVLASVMDIYAAGGRPTSFAVALSYSDKKIGEDLLQGLIEGSHAFKIPIVRGHTNSQSESTYVVGSATGTVEKNELLTSGGAKKGDALVLLFDSDGKQGSSYKLGWDSVTARKSETILERLTVMNELATHQLLNASKDISVAGLVGTAGMMVEYSDKGGIIDLDAANDSRPKSISLEDWLRMYISLGFLVAVSEENLPQVKKIATKHGMNMYIVGSVDEFPSLRLKLRDEERVMFDFSKGPILIPRGRNS